MNAEIKLSHSYSSINMFENCPLRYYRQRILKDVKDEGGEAAHYGTAVHEALEFRLKESRKLPRHLESCEPLCGAIESLATDGEVHAELELGLTKNLKPCEFMADDVWIRGIIDALVIRNDGTAYAFDWKTGKRRTDSFQLKLSAGFLFRHFPMVDQVSTGYIWLKDGTIDREVFKREDEVLIWKDIIVRIKRIEQALSKDVWPAKPSGLCRFCPARKDCQFAQL